MAATGYTPIQLYRTATSAAAPIAGNLANGELAINYYTSDMAIYAKSSTGSVIRLMNNPAGLKYPTADGTANQIIKTDGAGNLSFVTSAVFPYPGAGIANSTGSAWGTSYTTTGTGTVLALATSPTLVTPVLGTATATSITSNNIINTANAVTVNSNAGTVPITSRVNNFTNSSAAAMTITMATASAVDGQMTVVRIYDFSAVAQTISWVNTENSGTSVPAASNGSATLPLTVGFQYNGATSKWRCIASI